MEGKKSDQIRQLVFQKLNSGEYTPGCRLPSQNAFARQLGVSPNTVREAFVQLANAGIVRQVRGSGTFISDTPATGNRNLTVLIYDPQRESTDSFGGKVLSGLYEGFGNEGWWMQTRRFDALSEAERHIDELRLTAQPGSGVILAGFEYQKRWTDRLKKSEFTGLYARTAAFLRRQFYTYRPPERHVSGDASFAGSRP